MQAPRVRLSDLTLERTAGSALVLLATLDVRNPNPVAITLSDLRFGMEVFGRPVGDGRTPQRTIVLPALEATHVPIEISVAIAQLIDVLRGPGAESGALIPYRMHGSAGWEGSPIPLPFERRGELDVRRLLREGLRGVRPR